MLKDLEGMRYQGGATYSRFRRAVILFAACAGFCLLPGTIYAQEWYVNYEKGMDAYRNKHWQAAVQSLSEAIADQSDSKTHKRMPGLQFVDYYPYLYRGIAYYNLNEKEKARADLEKTEGEKEIQEDSEAAKLLNDYLALLRKPAVAQTDARYTEGMKLYRTNDFKGAIEQFKLVPENSAQHNDAVKYRGLAESRLRDSDAAATAKDRREKIDKALVAGSQYLKQNELDNAETQFKAALDIDGKNAEAQKALTRIAALRQKSAPPPSVATRKEPAPEQPHTVTGPPPDAAKDVLFREAVTLYTGGRIVQAKAKFLDVRQLDPAYPELTTYLKSITDTEEKIRKGIAAFFAGEYQQAIDQLRETSKTGNDIANNYAFLACSYAAQYLLTGAEDRSLRQNAVDAFVQTKKVDTTYKLNDKDISPKIISLLRGD